MAVAPIGTRDRCRRSAHGPARQRFRTRLGETIDAALDPEEPAVHVVQEYFRGIRRGGLDLGCPARPAGKRRRAGQRPLAVGGHDRRLGRATENRIAEPPPVLIDQPRSAFWIAPRPPWTWLHQHLDTAGGGHAEQAETQKPAQLAHARIALAAGARRRAHREPDLVASRGAVDALEHELEVEAELQLADHDQRRFVRAQGHQVAAADFAFDVESEAFEKALHRDVERRLPHGGYWLWGGLMQHDEYRREDGLAPARGGRTGTMSAHGKCTVKYARCNAAEPSGAPLLFILRLPVDVGRRLCTDIAVAHVLAD